LKGIAVIGIFFTGQQWIEIRIVRLKSKDPRNFGAARIKKKD